MSSKEWSPLQYLSGMANQDKLKRFKQTDHIWLSLICRDARLHRKIWNKKIMSNSLIHHVMYSHVPTVHLELKIFIISARTGTKELNTNLYKRSNNSSINFILVANSWFLEGIYPSGKKNSKDKRVITNLKIVTFVEYPEWSSTKVFRKLWCVFQR